MNKEKKLAEDVGSKDAVKVLKHLSSKRGSRLKGNRVKIGQLGNEQFVVTIPKSFALGYNFKKGVANVYYKVIR